VAAACTVVVALFLTPLFAPLPEATLAAIVMVAVSGMVKWREVLRLYRLRRTDFALAMVTFLGVITLEETLWALLLAVLLSLLALALHTSKAQLVEIGLARGRLTFEEVGTGTNTFTIPHLLILKPGDALFFANADTARVDITNRLAASAEPVDTVLLDLELTGELDVPSADMLKELHDDLATAGTTLALARVQPSVRDLLDRSGITKSIGEANFYHRTLEGVIVHVSRRSDSSDQILSLSATALGALQSVLTEMLQHAEGEHRERLVALQTSVDATLHQTMESRAPVS
jgi:MFS superfamily sulfate permease-like transporter